jgi:biopolymer transport protein ExbD
MLQPRKNSLRNLICRIDVTAFAAVMFALVAMFLGPAAVVDHHDRISVDLAKVSHPASMPKELGDDVMEVAITRDGQTYFNLDRVLPDGLTELIRASVSHGGERKVYIRADSRTKYGYVKQAAHAVRLAGIEDIAFVVDQAQR